MGPTLVALAFTLGTGHAAERSGAFVPAPAVAPALSELTYNAAHARFSRGSQRILRGRRLMWTGVGVAVGGAGILVGSLWAASLLDADWFDGGWGVVGGLGGLAFFAGTGLVVASPFVLASGLSMQRSALAELGVTAGRSRARAALGTGIAGGVMLVWPPAGIAMLCVSNAFSLAQARQNQALLATVRLTPDLYRDGGGLRLRARF